MNPPRNAMIILKYADFIGLRIFGFRGEWLGVSVEILALLAIVICEKWVIPNKFLHSPVC